MKRKLINIIKISLFAALAVFLLFAASGILERKDSDYKYSDFFDQAKKENIDVLFLGSSHVINAINPLDLYENYGYTSYNMGGHGSVLPATYWELIESLDYCTPKWVVVDAYMLEKDYQYLDVMESNANKDEINTSVDQLHLNMDCFPLNRLKIAAINDLIMDSEIRKEFLMDSLIYHGRWSELTEADYRAFWGNSDNNPMFGAEMRYDVERAPVFYPDPEPGQVLENHTMGQEYLMKIIDECQRRGIGVLVTYLPFCATTTDKIAANSTGNLAAIYGVPYINMLDMDIIDIYTDLNDIGHLNVTGAKKVTDYIGNWLNENADLMDHRGDDRYSDYAEKVSDYHLALTELILDNADLYTELDLLSLSEVGEVVYFNQESQVFTDKTVKKLVANISGTDKIDIDDGPYILIDDVASGNIYEACKDEMIDGAQTAMGSLVYQPVEKRFRFLYAKENEELNYLYDDEHIDHDIRIIIYDKQTGELLGQTYYRSYGNTYRQ